MREGAEATSGDRGIAERVRQDADEQPPPRVELRQDRIPMLILGDSRHRRREGIAMESR